MNTGWQCPVCNRGYAPWVPSCGCVGESVGSNTTQVFIRSEPAEDLERILEDTVRDMYERGTLVKLRVAD